MARPNSAMHAEPVTRGYQRSVVPFDNHRRRLHLEHLTGGESHLRGVVVHLPMPAGRRALQHRTDAQTRPSDSNGPLTLTEYIVAFLLFLSTLTGPALVWTLLSL